MVTFSGFVGVVVEGKPHVLGPDQVVFNVTAALGSGFVVDPEQGWIVTARHVIDDAPPDATLAFGTLDAHQRLVYDIVDRATTRYWADRDVAACRIRKLNGKPPDGLRNYPPVSTPLDLCTQVSVLGFPKNHGKFLNDGKTEVTIRALTGFVVTGYDHEMEVGFPVIRGMSGGPVMARDRIAGLAYLNRQYATDGYATESTKVVGPDRVEKIETTRYEEVQRFGVFYRAEAFWPWLATIGVK